MPDLTDTITALRAVAAFAETNELPIPGRVRLDPNRPGGHRVRYGQVVSTLPWDVRIGWVRSMPDLLEWARVLDVTRARVRVQRGPETCLDIIGVAADITWHINGLYGRRLGATDEVIWDRLPSGRRDTNGWMTTEALTALKES